MSIENFNDIYEKIINENTIILENARIKAQNNDLDLEKYKKEFKEKVIATLIKSLNKDLEYKQYAGISPLEYKEADFEDFFKCHSEDSMFGKFEGSNICISEITTEERIENGNLDSTYNKIFSGLFCKIDNLNNINSKLYLRKDMNENLDLNNLNKLKFKDLRIKLDSSNFENKFDIYTDNEEFARKLLNNDVMNMLVEFNNRTEVDFEFTIKNECLYIRFWCENMFEIGEINEFSLDKKLLFKYYKILYFLFELTSKLKKIVLNTNND